MIKQITSLTVREIKDLLNQFDDDLPVVFSYSYGDHWHTVALGEINQAQEEAAEWSGYHEMFKLGDEGTIPVLVLS
jgi:hypothetical protein